MGKRSELLSMDHQNAILKLQERGLDTVKDVQKATVVACLCLTQEGKKLLESTFGNQSRTENVQQAGVSTHSSLSFD
jgi:hypothetical protein